jgi:hypothetical protein
VRERKRTWTGARLGEGFPDAFGQLLDHSCALRFNENPDYPLFQTLFDDFSHETSESHETFGEPNIVSLRTAICEHLLPFLMLMA